MVPIHSFMNKAISCWRGFLEGAKALTTLAQDRSGEALPRRFCAPRGSAGVPMALPCPVARVVSEAESRDHTVGPQLSLENRHTRTAGCERDSLASFNKKWWQLL